MALQYNFSARCEWCGEHITDGEKVTTPTKDGQSVIYHETCEINDMQSLDVLFVDATQAVMFW